MKLRTRAFVSRNYPNIPAPTFAKIGNSENIVPVKSNKKDPTQLQLLVNEKMKAIQASVAFRKQLLASMKRDLGE